MMAWCAAARDVPYNLTHIVSQYAGFLRLEIDPGPVAFELRCRTLTPDREIIGTGSLLHSVYSVFGMPLFGHVEVLTGARNISHRAHVSVYVCPQLPAFLPPGCDCEHVSTLRLDLRALGNRYVDDRLVLLTGPGTSSAPCGARCGSALLARKHRLEKGHAQDGDQLFVQLTMRLSHPVAVDMAAAVLSDCEPQGQGAPVPARADKDGRVWASITTDPRTADGIHGSLVIL